MNLTFYSIDLILSLHRHCLCFLYFFYKIFWDHFFFFLSNLVARAHTIKLWKSGVSEVQTPAPAYNMQYPYQLS